MFPKFPTDFFEEEIMSDKDMRVQSLIPPKFVRCDVCKWWDEQLVGKVNSHICINDAINEMVTGAMFPPADFSCSLWSPK